MRFKPRRSSPRLDSFSYRGRPAYHLILTTHNRLSRFRDRRLVISCLDCLASSASRCGFEIIAYCFMPNYLHMLVSGSEGAPLVRFVQHFKQATGHQHPGLWQRSYYDHILRHEEAVEDVARYIWGNPVRAGMVEDVIHYPYSGPRELMVGYADGGSYAQDRAKALSLRPAGEGYPQQEVPVWKQ